MVSESFPRQRHLYTSVVFRFLRTIFVSGYRWGQGRLSETFNAVLLLLLQTVETIQKLNKRNGDIFIFSNSTARFV